MSLFFKNAFIIPSLKKLKTSFVCPMRNYKQNAQFHKLSSILHLKIGLFCNIITVKIIRDRLYYVCGEFQKTTFS